MTAVPLGRGAYLREYAGSPEVVLLNRWLEQNPANLREHSSVLGRPGTTPLLELEPGSYSGTNIMRGNYALSGLFNDSLFTVCGENLYMISQSMQVTQIEGIINGTGHPEVAWQRGAGYERLWIADGLLLQYYDGTTAASASLSLNGSTVTPGTDKFEVGGVYYTWGTTFSVYDAGTAAHPFIVNPTPSTGGTQNPLAQLTLAIIAGGNPGVDYSATITGPNTLVSCATLTSGTGVPPLIESVTLTAIASGTQGNSITLSVTGGTALTASNPTLINGGINTLEGCPMPNGLSALSITQVSGYILVSVANSQQFYWVNPGETTINALNFASKESSPDNIQAMRCLGDQIAIIGTKSFENWYATGNSQSPFAPIEGRVYARGALNGTAVVVDEGIFIVGDDGRVYSIGYQVGDGADIGWGVTRVSNNGIEERVRMQTRREAGLTP